LIVLNAAFVVRRLSVGPTKLLLISAAWCGLLLSFGPMAHAQVEIEPNDSCEAPQVFGAFDPPLRIDGFLMAVGPSSSPFRSTPDLETDFIELSAEPGRRLLIDVVQKRRLTGVALESAVVAAFDSTCSVILRSLRMPPTDPSVFVLATPRLAISVPDDGRVIVRITGQGPDRGGYRLLVQEEPLPFGTLRARLVDSVTREPLRGNLRLAECVRPRCDETQPASFGLPTDPESGEVVFPGTSTSGGRPAELRAGSYVIEASVSRAQPQNLMQRSQLFGPFVVGEGEDLDVGELAFRPNPIDVTDLQDCIADIPSEGGLCRYSARIRNNTDEQLRASVYSFVEADVTLVEGESFTETEFGFEASPTADPGRLERTVVDLAPGADVPVAYEFLIGPLAGPFSRFCARLALAAEPSPLAAPMLDAELFCVRPPESFD